MKKSIAGRFWATSRSTRSNSRELIAHVAAVWLDLTARDFLTPDVAEALTEHADFFRRISA